MSNGWRYIATRLNGDGTEEILHWDLPLSDVKITKALSGPDGISATIRPEHMGVSDLLTPWSTGIYAECDGAIRAGCILVDRKAKSETLGFDAFGFSAYPSGMPYMGDKMVYADTDPTLVVEAIWDYLQAQPGGNLGLQVNLPDTPMRTGLEEPPEEQPRDEASGQYKVDDIIRSVVLEWHKTLDLVKPIDELVKGTPFDYVEQHSWQSDRVIKHELVGGYPMLGRRRDDLRFVIGENCLDIPDAITDGAMYASEILVLGAGEGEAMVRTQQGRPGETRLRRVAVVSDRTLVDQNAARAVAGEELALRLGNAAITSIAVIDHPNAGVGSYSLGDEILIQTGPAGWQGDLKQWSRITEITYSPDNASVAALKVMPVI